MKSIFNNSYISKLILPEPLNNYANKIIVTEVYKLNSYLIYEVKLQFATYKLQLILLWMYSYKLLHYVEKYNSIKLKRYYFIF